MVREPRVAQLGSDAPWSQLTVSYICLAVCGEVCQHTAERIMFDLGQGIILIGLAWIGSCFPDGWTSYRDGVCWVVSAELITEVSRTAAAGWAHACCLCSYSESISEGKHCFCGCFCSSLMCWIEVITNRNVVNKQFSLVFSSTFNSQDSTSVIIEITQKPRGVTLSIVVFNMLAGSTASQCCWHRCRLLSRIIMQFSFNWNTFVKYIHLLQRTDAYDFDDSLTCIGHSGWHDARDNTLKAHGQAAGWILNSKHNPLF